MCIDRWMDKEVVINIHNGIFNSASCVRLFATLWTAACQASLSFITPRVYLNSCPLTRWCHPTISSSVIPYSSCLLYLPATGCFQVSQFFASVQFSSVAQVCLTLCDRIDCSMPGLPVHHHLPEFTQTHVHWVSDAIQPSHPLSSPSPSAFSFSQHQGLFQWVRSSHQVSKVLEFQLQHQSFQWTPRMISFRMDWLDLLVVQGTLKNLLQYHSSKALILWCSAFFISLTLTSIHDYWIKHSLD